MSQKASPALVGAFVLGALLLALAGVVLLGTKDFLKRTFPFVSYFEGSVDGLSVGSPVKYKGVEIGSVDEIRLALTGTADDPPIVVFFSLDAAKLQSSQDDQLELAELERAIAVGLRAQLEQQSLLTGLRFVSIVFLPESEAKLHEPIPGIPEIPSVPMELEEITSRLKKFVGSLEGVDLTALVQDVQGVFRSLQEVLSSERIASTLTSLEGTLEAIRAAAASFEKEFPPLAESLRSAADQLQTAGADVGTTLASVRETSDRIRALAQALEESVSQVSASLETTLVGARTMLDPTSPPVVRLEQALADLSATARAARSLIEILERDPSALLRGKAQTEGQR